MFGGSFLPSWIRIRIQRPHWIRIQFGSNLPLPTYDMLGRRIQQKLKKKSFFEKNCNLLYPTYRRSLQPSSTSKMKFMNFFSMFVGHFFPLGSGYGSRDPIESGSNPDPACCCQHMIGMPRKACYCQHMICQERLAIANIWYARKSCFCQ